MAREEGERLVAELVALARGELSGEPPRSTVRALPPLRRPAPRSFRRPVSWALAAAALATVLVAFLLVRPDPITYRVVNGTEVAGTVVGATESTRLRFSEGSEVVLAPGAEAQVATLDAHGGTLRVRRGRVRVAITPRADANWVVHAGPYAVRVTGTEFDLSWNDAERRFEVAMHAGSVEVTSAVLPGPIRLAAGQRLVRRDDAAPEVTEVAALAPPVSAPAEAREETPPASTAKPAPPTSKPTREARAAVRAEDGVAWARLVAQGNFDAVLDAAKRKGIEAVIARAPLTDLDALADAARYARRTDLAERVLLAKRQRFAGTAAARDAAFLLGQLAESRGQPALTWYETYLSEAPDGSYAPQALGRKLMIKYAEGGAASAAPIATQYLARHPRGPYAAAARKILSEAPGKEP
nr:MAG: hypothetical protein DIU78_22855 [Pseudomonadota bacterium]